MQVCFTDSEDYITYRRRKLASNRIERLGNQCKSYYSEWTWHPRRMAVPWMTFLVTGDSLRTTLAWHSTLTSLISMLAVTGVRMNIVLVSDKGQVKHEPEKCALPPIIPPLFYCQLAFSCKRYLLIWHLTDDNFNAPHTTDEHPSVMGDNLYRAAGNPSPTTADGSDGKQYPYMYMQ